MNITKLLFVASMSWLLLTPTILQAKDFKDSEITHVEYPGWFINNPFMDLSEDLENARTAGKQGLMVIYSTEGCSYCTKFIETSLGDSEIAKTIRKNFGSVGLEIFDDSNLVTPTGRESTIKDFAKQEGVMFSPTILFYDKEGKRVLRITGYQSPERFKTSLNYVVGQHYQSQTMAQYKQSITKQKKSPLSSNSLQPDPLFAKPPYALQRNIVPAKQPLLVIFESTGCKDCEVFHNKVLANQEVRSALSEYEVVRFDSNDNKSKIITPNGSRTSPASWYKQKGFSRTPALVFFNEKGLVAVKTDNLVLENRMMNTINYVKESAYAKGWSYQRFARSKAIERNIKKKKTNKTAANY